MLENFLNLNFQDKEKKKFFQNIIKNYDINLSLKVGKSSSTIFVYDEVLNFENIAFDNKRLFGFMPFQSSSVNLKKFINQENKYIYNCSLIYATDQSYFILRSNSKNIEFNSFYYSSSNPDEHKKVYEDFSWNTKAKDYEILYDTREGYDEKRITNLINEVQKGRKVKVHFKYENYNYILSPYINYNSYNSDGKKFISCKISPICLLPKDLTSVTKISEADVFINTEGSISFLIKKNYQLDNSNKKNLWKSFLLQLKNFIPKKKHQLTFKIDTKWYLEK